jgi:hypothetical protein
MHRNNSTAAVRSCPLTEVSLHSAVFSFYLYICFPSACTSNDYYLSNTEFRNVNTPRVTNRLCRYTDCNIQRCLITISHYNLHYILRNYCAKRVFYYSFLLGSNRIRPRDQQTGNMRPEDVLCACLFCSSLGRETGAAVSVQREQYNRGFGANQHAKS